MPDVEAITEARQQLDLAVERYMGIVADTHAVVDWYLAAEVVHDTRGAEIQIAESPTMTSWKRWGLMKILATSFGFGS